MTASSTPSLAADERAALADLLAELGPDAPTCCAGWTTAHLAAHVVTRDRRPDAMPGYGLEQLSPRLGGWAHHVEDRLRESADYADVVGPAAQPRGELLQPVTGHRVGTAVAHDQVRRQVGRRPARAAGGRVGTQLLQQIGEVRALAAGQGRAAHPATLRRVIAGEWHLADLTIT